MQVTVLDSVIGVANREDQTKSTFKTFAEIHYLMAANHKLNDSVRLKFYSCLWTGGSWQAMKAIIWMCVSKSFRYLNPASGSMYVDVCNAFLV